MWTRFISSRFSTIVVLIASCLLVALPTNEALAQQTSKILRLPFGTHGSTGYFLFDSTFVSMDFESGDFEQRDLRDGLGLFDWQNKPEVHSSSISLDGKYVWLWDSSVGSGLRIGIAEDTTITFFPRRSSHIQFGHAGGLNPLRGNPIAFSGYGYYRTKEFMVEYDLELDTWVEIPFDYSQAPEPRMAGVMASLWHPSKVLVLGGNGVVEGSRPPAYSNPLEDAWIFDMEGLTWSQVDVPGALVCSLQKHHRGMGYMPSDARTHSIFVLMEGPCVDESHFINSVYQWFPESGKTILLGAIPATLPVFAVPVAGFVDTDSSRLNMIFWRPMEGKPVEDWARWNFKFDLAEDVPVASAGRPDYFWLILVFLVVGGLGVLYYVFPRTRKLISRDVEIDIKPDLSGAVLSNNGTTHNHHFSLNAALLLTHFVQQKIQLDSILSSEDLMHLFERDYPDPDTARVVKNRAINEINDYFKLTFGRPFLDRQRSESDRRKHVFVAQYSLMPI